MTWRTFQRFFVAFDYVKKSVFYQGVEGCLKDLNLLMSLGTKMCYRKAVRVTASLGIFIIFDWMYVKYLAIQFDAYLSNEILRQSSFKKYLYETAIMC